MHGSESQKIYNEYISQDRWRERAPCVVIPGGTSSKWKDLVEDPIKIMKSLPMIRGEEKIKNMYKSRIINTREKFRKKLMIKIGGTVRGDSDNKSVDETISEHGASL